MSDITNYENLANAIIEQAAKDYLRVVKAVERQKDARAALKKALGIEAFFHPKWYGTLMQKDPDYLIERLRKEAMK